MKSASSLEDLLARFEPITLEEMDRVKLQARMDTKYVFSAIDLPAFLEKLLPEYRILEVNGERGVGYRSLYFDTTDRRSFLQHHNGRTFRNKVRFREYVGSGLRFLEVKRKTGRGGTDKVREQVTAVPEFLNEEQLAFIASASGSSDPLEAVLWNTFTRLTLVHHTRHERLTIDRALTFSTADRSCTLEGICVAELKEERADRSSPFMRLMRESGNRSSSMSKYCVGMLLLGMAPKHNTFKPTMLHLARLRPAA